MTLLDFVGYYCIGATCTLILCYNFLLMDEGDCYARAMWWPIYLIRYAIATFIDAIQGR